MRARPKPWLRRLPALLLISAAGLAWWPAPARADGAFPDALSIMTPEALPAETLLATNFGLVMSFDGDRTWVWSCEQGLNSFATLYQLGPAPLSRIYAISSTSLIYSDDRSCSWTASAPGTLDAFVDPTDPNRVLAVVATTGDGGSTYSVVESADAGATFPRLVYRAAAGNPISGVEISRSAPQTVYLTLTSGSSNTPQVAATTDGGDTWTLHDLSGSLAAGTYTIRLVSVDPNDSLRLFLRVGSAAGEALAVSTDGGISTSSPLSFPGGVFTAFTRMASGSLIAGGVIGTSSVAYRSINGGATFQQLPTVPFTFRGLSARGTKLYAALDNAVDPYAIETSPDEGMTWQPLMSYDQIQAIQTCVKSICQDDCLTRAGADQWSADLCSATDMPATPDGSPNGGPDGAPDGGPGARADGGGGRPPDGGPSDGGRKDAPGTPASGGGCQCGVVAGPATGRCWSALIAAMLMRRRRRR